MHSGITLLIMASLSNKKCIDMTLGYCSLMVDDQLPCNFCRFQIGLLSLSINAQTMKSQEANLKTNL